MINVDRILCPVDFSDNADTATIWARDLAERFEAELHFLHVVDDLSPVLPEPGMAMYSGSELFHEIREAARKRLDELDAPASAVKTLGKGSPFVEIVRYAKQNDVDLIVMGTHGRTGLSHMLLGSVAERVVRKAPCAVLTIRPDGHRFEMP